MCMASLYIIMLKRKSGKWLVQTHRHTDTVLHYEMKEKERKVLFLIYNIHEKLV